MCRKGRCSSSKGAASVSGLFGVGRLLVEVEPHLVEAGNVKRGGRRGRETGGHHHCYCKGAHLPANCSQMDPGHTQISPFHKEMIFMMRALTNSRITLYNQSCSLLI